MSLIYAGLVIVVMVLVVAAGAIASRHMAPEPSSRVQYLCDALWVRASTGETLTCASPLKPIRQVGTLAPGAEVLRCSHGHAWLCVPKRRLGLQWDELSRLQIEDAGNAVPEPPAWPSQSPSPGACA